jgi:hypothetical protein
VTAFDMAGQKDEAAARARLDAMVGAIIKGIDEVERQFLQDLDNLPIAL